MIRSSYIKFHVFILVALFVGFANVAKASLPGLPPEAQKLLKQLPGNKLTLDFVLAQAYRNSDSAQAILAGEEALDAARLQAMAPFTTELHSSAFYTKNDNDQASFFDPRSAQTYSLGASHYFQTGTRLGIDFIEQRSTLSAANTFALPNKSAAKFSISQNLWRDFFGYQGRRQMEAGEALTRSARLQQNKALQDWALSLVDLYHNAWLRQTQLAAARLTVERQRRLFSTTRLKLNRGTAERADFLQVESSYLLAQTEFEQTKQELQILWRSLVTNLKLPQSWLEIPAEYVPLDFSSLYAEGEKVCASLKIQPEESLEVLIAKEQMTAADALYDVAVDSSRPTLTLEGGYTTSGSLGTFSDRSKDALGGENPEWSVGLNFKVYLDNPLHRAERFRASVEKNRSRILLSQAQSNQQSDLLNDCAELKTLKESSQGLEKISGFLSQRYILEEQRFQIGRTGTFNVIMAGDDFSRSEIQWQQSRVKLNKKVWDLLKYQQSVVTYLEKINKQHRSLEF